MAVTADRRVIIENGNILGLGECPMIATTGVVYGGAMVIANATGNCTNATDAASSRFVGVAREGATNTGVAGAVIAKLYTSGDFLFNINSTTLDATDIGKTVFIFDNDTVTDAAGATNDVPVGTLIRLPSATTCIVRIQTPGFAAS
jgi:hypothetical protein